MDLCGASLILGKAFAHSLCSLVGPQLPECRNDNKSMGVPKVPDLCLVVSQHVFMEEGKKEGREGSREGMEGGKFSMR